MTNSLANLIRESRKKKDNQWLPYKRLNCSEKLLSSLTMPKIIRLLATYFTFPSCSWILRPPLLKVKINRYKAGIKKEKNLERKKERKH
jgi:hypothetical protein